MTEQQHFTHPETEINEARTAKALAVAGVAVGSILGGAGVGEVVGNGITLEAAGLIISGLALNVVSAGTYVFANRRGSNAAAQLQQARSAQRDLH